MSLFAFASRVARREMRGALRPLSIFVIALAIGIATIASVGVLSQSLRETVRRDARALLGGDLELESANQPVSEDELARLFGPESRRSTILRTTALASAPNGRRLAVALKAVDEAWPLVGAVELDPPIPISEALKNAGAVVEPSLLQRLGLALGDRLRIGTLELEIRAILMREPDRLGSLAGFGPRVLVSLASAEAADLIRPGALLRFEHRAVVAPSELPQLVAQLRAREAEASWRLRTALAVEPSIARFSDRLAGYLTLAGLAALLLGGLGVALSVSAYLASRRTTIAILKALGATSAEVDAAFGMLIGAALASAVLLGLALGQLLPLFLVPMLEAMLPVRVALGFHPLPLLHAAIAGVLTAVLFASYPLARAREVSAADLFRADILLPAHRLRLSGLLVPALAASGLVVLSMLAVDRAWLAALFFTGVLITAGFLGTIGRLLLAFMARALANAPVALRLAARNLARSASGALPALLGLGTGLAALVAIALLEANLAREIHARLAQRAPTHVVIDIQPDQWPRFERVVAQTQGVTLLQSAPTVRARITRIKGEPVERAAIADHVRWTIDRDRGLSWSAHPPPGTELLAGRWWSPDYDGPPLVSIEGGVARGYGVAVGDKLTFNLLGRSIEAEIANIRREVDWTSGRLDFVFILSPGVIDKAPHVRIAALSVAPSAVAPFLERLATELPNATPIDVGAIVRAVEEILGTIDAAVRLIAVILLLVGLLVLAASLLLARRRHLRETILLKLLGAPRSQILAILAAEHLLLALSAAIVGVVAGTLAGWAISRFVLAIGWQFALAPVLFVTALVLVSVFAIAAISVWRLLGRSAAVALRMP